MAETGTQTPVVELAAFEACALNAPIAGVDQVGMPAISTAYGQASASAASPAKDVYLLLSAVAGIAIDAYCDCVEGLMNGSLKAFVPIDGRNLIDAQTPAHRALQISSATKKGKAPHSNRLVSGLTSLYRQARQEAQPVIFSRLAQLCVDYGLIDKREGA